MSLTAARGRNARASNAYQPAPTKVGPRRVLIVDDEPLIVEMLTEHFKVEHDVVTTLTGIDALGAVLLQRPDVVLLDINMPGMNGMEVLKAIKQIDNSIAVIMVTANEDGALAAAALKSGAFGYVPKPFDFRYLNHLLAAIFDTPKDPRR